MFSESLGKFLEILKNEEDYRIQIITRENIKLFMEYLDFNKLDYHVNCWNNYTEDESEIIIYTSPNEVEFSARRIILFSNQRHRDFIQFVFVPTYNDKLKYLEYIGKPNKKILDMYKSSSIQDLIRKIGKKDVDLGEFVKGSFDYQEILLLYAVAKCSSIKEIFDHVANYDQKADNTFILRIKLNGLVSRGLVLFRNNYYKLNISIDTLSSICKTIELNVYA